MGVVQLVVLSKNLRNHCSRHQHLVENYYDTIRLQIVRFKLKVTQSDLVVEHLHLFIILHQSMYVMMSYAHRNTYVMQHLLAVV